MNKLRAFARNQPCTLLLPGCDGGGATTVLAHGRGGGMGTKLHDTQGCHACAPCHAQLDAMSRDEFWRVFPNAERLTLNRLHEAGLL